MTNTIEFEVALKRAGLTKTETAKALGISVESLTRKANNLNEFKASELAKLYQMLKLETYDEQKRIFFASGVD